MKTYCSILLAFLFTNFLSSQTNLSGIINNYAKVITFNACESSVTVSDPQSFQVGESVIIIQMQGATILDSDNDSFGDISEIGSAGFYESATILNIVGDAIFFEHLFINEYDPAGQVQLVSFPKYSDAIVTEELNANTWNGTTGGVLALEIENTLTLNADISVTGLGFRGAEINVLESNCGFLTNANDYFYPITNWRGAPKGEGVASIITGKEAGRGAQANGGGGGNDHNSGGGGGANITTGGQGGEQDPSSIFGCSGDFPGKGGKPISANENRIFMGGGGGAGHVDNDGFGSGGANGGGIIILVANTVEGNGHRISSNGQNAAFSNGDGAGGGGGGGSLILEIQNINNLNIECMGGNGGSVANEEDRCFGPGGGGSGGRILSINNFFNVDMIGGMAGVNTINSGECNGLSNGATEGELGISETLITIPSSQVEVEPTFIFQNPTDTLVCEDGAFQMSIDASGNFLEFQWQVNTGTGFEDLNNGANITGVNTDLLSISNIDVSMDENEYRCLVFNSCEDSLFSTSANLFIEASPNAEFSWINLDVFEIQFSNLSSNGDTYEWDFGDFMNSTELNPTHTFNEAGIYTVTLSTMNTCGNSTFSQMIAIGESPQANFTADFQSGCVPFTAHFTNLSLGSENLTYEWLFPGGTPNNSSEENPTIIYENSGFFDVQLNVTNVLGSDTLINTEFIQVEDFPAADFDFSINGLTVNFQNLSIGGNAFYWEFGDDTFSEEENPSHTFAEAGIYNIVFSASSFNCTSTVSQEILIEIVGTEETESSFFVKLFPIPTGDKLNIEISPTSFDTFEIQISNTSGSVIVEKVLYQTNSQINLTEIPTGLYFLKIKKGNKIFVSKFTKG